MVDMKVQLLKKQHIVEPDKRQDKPLMWAINKFTRAVTHVGTLLREQTGLRCDCICPACNSTLQAVNAGRDSSYFEQPNSRGQFFRHQTGQQKDTCSIVTARITALQLLADLQQINVPRPWRTSSLRGISGSIYSEICFGSEQHLRIRHRQWIDSHSAKLVLENGKVVLLQLESHFQLTAAGNYDGVITIQVNDPEVASWTADKILTHAQLDKGILCWRSHWEDADLDAEATALVKVKAINALDHVPENVLDTSGFSSAQQSESVLHFAIKEILSKASSIRAPSYRDVAVALLPDGSSCQEPFSLDWGNLQISNVRLEQRLGNIVPDVICQARHSKGEFQMMIEVVVTNPVSYEKLAKIKQLNTACLELNISGFIKFGRMSLNDLKSEVLNSVRNKAWLFHPLIESERAFARKRLDGIVQQAKASIKKSEFFYSQLNTRTSEQLPKFFLQSVVENDKLFRSGHDFELMSGQKIKSHIDLHALTKVLRNHGWDSADDMVLVKPGGVLCALACIQDSSIGTQDAAEAAVIKLEEMSLVPSFRSYVILLLMSFRVYHPALSHSQRIRYEKIRTTVKRSLERQEFDFARSTRHDRLLRAIFPEMGEMLASPYGTDKYIRDLHAQAFKEDVLRRDEEEKRRRHSQARLLHAASTEKLRKSIEKMSEGDWPKPVGFCRDFEQAMRVTAVSSLIKKMSMRSIDAVEILASAFNARNTGIPMKSWIQSRKPSNIEELDTLYQILKTAWLIV